MADPSVAPVIFRPGDPALAQGHSQAAGITSGVETITPEIAQDFLDHMGQNRLPKKNAISKYAEDMQAGRWYLTGEPVIIDWNGEMRDGQNRMHAIIRAGIPVRMMVVRGVDPAGQIATDIGVPRRLADIIAISTGTGVHSRVAAVASRMYRWDVLGERISRRSGSPSYQAVVSYFRDHEAEVTEGAAFEEKRGVKNLFVPSAFGVIRVILWRVDRDAADDFLAQVTEGTAIDPSSPVLTLRNRLITDRRASRHDRIKQGSGPATEWPPGEIQMALTFQAWNHWRSGRTPGRLQLPRDLVRFYPVPK